MRLPFRRHHWAGLTAVVLLLTLVPAGVQLAVHGTRSAAEASSVASSSGPVDGPAPTPNRPNILLITTDDMADGDLRWMPRTRAWLQQQGADLTDFISPHPLCCPARAEILTGQYAQNNGVRHNKGSRGGWAAYRGRAAQNIGAWLRAGGYETAFAGKFLNGYETTGGLLPGWDHWNPTLAGTYNPYDFWAYDDGSPQLHRGIHITDWLGAQTNRYVEEFAATSKPFFIWASYVAPHTMTDPTTHRWVPPISAERHARLFPAARPPSMSKPTYRRTNKGSNLGVFPSSEVWRLTDVEIVRMFRARIRSLQGVDEAVDATMRTLQATGQLDNTYVFFTSDNGYLMGEHNLMGKNFPYEGALQIPGLVRGPGIAPGTRSRMTSLVDLAPTFLDIAGATAGHRVDGVSLLPYLRGLGGGYRTSLIQAGHVKRAWLWRGVRTARYTYARYPRRGFVELYDRKVNPHQRRNVARDPDYARVVKELERRRKALADCAGPERCNRDFGAVPRPRRR